MVKYIRKETTHMEETKKRPKLSVIISISNVESYFAECLDSVLMQK